MKLDSALDEFELLQRRRQRGEEGQRASLALASLREYLTAYSGFEETDAVTPAELLSFLFEYYPRQEEPDRRVAVALLEVCAAFALWLLERGERRLAPFVAVADRLREDLPRVLQAFEILQEHVRQHEIRSVLDVAADEDGEAEAAISSGVDRVVRLDEVDYPAAEEEYFTVRAVKDGALTLQSAEREALGEAPAAPVAAPSGATALLRPGDTIHAEIAPGPGGWELLEVFGIRPGGY
jgi:hypothetical protein